MVRGLILSAVFLAVLGFSVPGHDTAISQIPFDGVCDTEPTPLEYEMIRARHSQPLYNFGGPSGGPYCIPIAAHIVRRDDGTGGMPLSQLEQGIADCNAEYANMNMKFYLISLDYIDDTDYYQNINSGAEIDALRGENVVADMINMYFAEVVNNGTSNICGRSSFPGTSPQGIVFANDCVGVASNPSTFPHEVGHYFDLLHTHSTTAGAELVDGSNCATAGDLLCDTPADPTLVSGGSGQNVTAAPGCSYYGTATDANGDSYNPDTSQIMSYAPKLCRVNFSPMSEARILTTLLTESSRLALLSHGCAPTADAGTDIVAECSSHTTTPVKLDGSGSSDPDGDPLTFFWEAPGVALDDPTLEKPTGDFPKGTSIAILVVTDDFGYTSDPDTVQVTVVDTTPPTLTCAPDTTIECTSHDGTPKTDDQIKDWCALATATDVCDSNVPVSNNAPAIFPLGTTVVRFVATDDDGNADTCYANVHVVDTTPPEITISNYRDMLWPPNHKYVQVDFCIEVTDICDADPTFKLVSASSSEPDNGKGDGNTTNDIADTSLCLPDTSVMLRSERRGGSDGRKYTIRWLASDASGNTTLDSACVYVPHDQSGSALCSYGFTLDGLTFEEGMDDATIVIPSQRPASVSLDGTKWIGGWDATKLDISRAYVGNTRGVVLPHTSSVQDVDGDGIDDIMLSYSVDEILKLVEGTEEIPTGSISLGSTAEAVGLHYIGPMEEPHLVSNIFGLGERVVPTIVKWGENYEPGDDARDVPKEVVAVYPNPFNPATTVDFYVAESGRAVLAIYDVSGRLVRTLHDAMTTRGVHSVRWDGTDARGVPVTSGIYFTRFVSGAGEVTKKMVLLK